MEKMNDKKVIRGWAMFDWANSAYNLVITSTIFPAYYTIITTTKEHGDKVHFFGKQFVNTALSNYALSIAYLIMAILLPFLSSTADYRGNKKSFMKAFTYLGAISGAPSSFLAELGIHAPAPAGSSRGASGPRVELDEGDPLVAALRTWRGEESRRIGKPAYVVFDNKTLVAIAAARPTSLGALAEVSGVGPAKLEKYGDAVLDVVRAGSDG